METECMKLQFRDQVAKAIREGKFKDRFANLTQTDVWNLEEVYQTVIDLDLTPLLLSVNQFYPTDADTLPSQTPTVPILVIIFKGDPVVLDGQHRVSNARKQNLQYVAGYVLNEELTDQLNQKRPIHEPR
jgi:hypothetical protein